jgi:LysM domain-containing protein
MSTRTSTTTLSPLTVEERPAVHRSGGASRAGAGSVRLTRRGRVVVFLVAFAIVLGLGLALGARSFAGEHPGTPEPTRVVMVGSGETLWDLAAGLADDGDVRGMVDRIEDLNALDSAMVQAGQRLRVPLQD